MPEIPLVQVVWREQERKHFGESELDDMAATIRVNGVIEPIIVFQEGDVYAGLCGQRSRTRTRSIAGPNSRQKSCSISVPALASIQTPVFAVPLKWLGPPLSRYPVWLLGQPPVADLLELLCPARCKASAA
jgi:hypothetical protein